MLRKIRKILKTAKSLIFGNSNYSLNILHVDWRAYNITENKPLGDPAVVISVKNHKCGRDPGVMITSPVESSYQILPGGDVMIKRGLSIQYGQPFPVTVTIFRK